MPWLIPLFCTLAALLLLSRGHLHLRASILYAMLITGVWTAAGAEVLGLFDLFRATPILVWWLLPCLAMAALLAILRVDPRPHLRPPVRPDGPSAVAIAITAVILLITGYIAASQATTTWDCWSYHLPRQIAWIQRGNLSHFPAHDLRQLEFPPFAEVLSAHWILLAKTDAWSNMHQWFSLLGLALATSLTARELGAGCRGQSIAALIAITAPPVITQATNGKNDIVVALWIAIFAWLAAGIWRARRFSTGSAAALGAALGLALYTKGTGYIFALPLCAVTGIAMLRISLARALPQGALIALIAIMINLPHWHRNYGTFESPLGLPHSRGGYPTTSATLHPAAIASSTIKNTASHLATPSDSINTAIHDAVAALHRPLAFDLNDPRTTMLAHFPYEVRDRFREDGNSTAPAHLLIALLLLAAAAVRPRLIRETTGWPAFLLPFIAWILFAALLRYQPWIYRLQIPMLALLAPVAGAMLPRLSGAAIKGPLLALAVALALWHLTFNSTRPLIGPKSVLTLSRDDSFTSLAPQIRSGLRQIESRVAELKPASVGLVLKLSGYEYPLMRAVRRAAPGAAIFPLNANFGPDKNTPVPDVVIAVNADGTAPLQQVRTREFFIPDLIAPPFAVYIHPDRRPAAPTDLPPFTGWLSSRGLDAPEGPYPKWDLPIVRWARTLETTLTFDSPGGPATLILDCRRNGRKDQVMTVLLNDQQVYHFPFGTAWRFFELSIPLETRPGRNTLVLRYANLNEPNPPRAVQFKKIQIIVPGPAGATTSPPSPAPSPSRP